MPSHKNRVVVACAGSRKTSSIVEEALALKGERVLITTYTNENVDQINSFFLQKHGCVPPHITVISWFSFLLQDGVRPYQNFVTNRARIGTVDFVSPINIFVPKTKPDTYFITKANDIFSDRVTEFICECDTKSGGLVVRRLEKIYSHIFIDEVQDFNGYDLDFLEKLFASSVSIVAVGDPRQATFTTNKGSKNRKFKKGSIHEWILAKQTEGLLSVEERVECYRSNQVICSFADELYPGLPKSISKNEVQTGHDGVFCIKASEVSAYYDKHKPVVLRHSKKTDTMNLPAFNIGTMKGKTFARVLIFPTKPMLVYLKTKDVESAGDLAKFYVAITRAQFSVAFVV